MSAALRLYAGCAELFTGRPAAANVVKLHRDRAAVSFLSYPRFHENPHPALDESLLVDLARRSETWTDLRAPEPPAAAPQGGVPPERAPPW